MEEQRVNRRARVNMRVAYRDTGCAYQIGTVSNISKGGMFIATGGSPDAVDDFLTASLDADSLGKIIWTQGHVVRRTSSGVGLAFTRMDRKGLETLMSYLGIA